MRWDCICFVFAKSKFNSAGSVNPHKKGESTAEVRGGEDRKTWVG